MLLTDATSQKAPAPRRPPGYVPGQVVKSEEVHEVDFLDELELIWGETWGAQSKIGKLRKALVCRPTENDAPPEAREDPISYGFLMGFPDLKKMQEEHDAFTRVLVEEGVTLEYLQVDEYQMGAYMRLRSLWATASAFVVNGGAIVPRYGRGPWRRGHEVLIARKLMEIGCPLLLTVHGKGVAELGGNGFWLDPKHIIIGIGSSGNLEGLRQVEPILRNVGAEEIHVAYFTGVAHLDLVLGIAGQWIAVIHRPHLDHETIRYLRRKGFELIETSHEEFRNGACNLLALDEKTVVLPKGCPRVAEALREREIRVIELSFDAINLAGGGPHCAVGALVRDPGPFLE